MASNSFVYSGARMRTWWGPLLVATGIASASPAVADTFNVKSVEVRKGESELAVEAAWQDGFPVNSDFLRQNYKLDSSYGFADWFKAGVELNLQQKVGESLKTKSAGVDTQFVIFQPAERSIGLAWYTRYDFGIETGESDVLTFGPLVSFALAQRLKVTLNPLFEKEWNPTKAGIKSSYAWQVKAGVNETISLGVEGYGEIPDIGDPPGIDSQEHRVGPVVYIIRSLDEAATAGSLKDMKMATADFSRMEGDTRPAKMDLQLGVLFGLTEATADIAYKAKLAVAF